MERRNDQTYSYIKTISFLFIGGLLSLVLFSYFFSVPKRIAIITETFALQPSTELIASNTESSGYFPVCSQISHELTDLYLNPDTTQPPAELFANCAGFIN